MTWYKRQLGPDEDFGSIFNAFEAAFVSLGEPREMALGIDEQGGSPGALYATIPDAVTAQALGFEPCVAPPATVTGALIGHHDVLSERFPPKG